MRLPSIASSSRGLIAVGGLMAALLISGCVAQSIHPLHSSDTRVSDDRLLGTWVDGGATWTFTGGDGGRYALAFSEGDETLRADAYLVDLGEARFLDIYVPEPPAAAGELYGALQLPLHTLLRVDGLEGSLRLSSMDQEWMKSFLAEQPDAAAHMVIENRIFLTAETPQLQRFFTDNAWAEDAWGPALEMRREAEGARRR